MQLSADKPASPRLGLPRLAGSPLDFVRQHALTSAAAAFLALLLVLLVLSPLLAFDSTSQNLAARLLPPLSTSATGRFYLLGSDQFGRDVASRLVQGAQVSLTVGIVSPLVAGVIGVPLGLIAGFWGGRVEEAIMRFVDLWMSLPGLLIALAILFIVGPGFVNLIAVLAIVRWVVFARLTRARVLSIREEQFVEAARCLGCSELRIAGRHVLPNLVSPILVLATLEIARAMLNEASLSFLGLGIQPPDSSWGTMLAEAREYMYVTPWAVLLPGLTIVWTTLSINLVAEWLHAAVRRAR